MSLSQWIERPADFAPDKIAIRCGAREVSDRALAAEIARRATAL